MGSNPPYKTLNLKFMSRKYETHVNTVENLVTAEICIKALSPGTKEKWDAFGIGPIDLGGTITKPDESTFAMNTRQVEFVIGVGQREGWSLEDHADAVNRAKGWLATVKSRLETAFIAMEAKTVQDEHTIETSNAD